VFSALPCRPGTARHHAVFQPINAGAQCVGQENVPVERGEGRNEEWGQQQK
jgi:hypothetical protein